VVIFIYFIYGLAFFAAGVLLAFQARLPVSVLPRFPLACLAAFALSHGSCEWSKMAAIEWPHRAATWEVVALALLVASYAMLMQFALETLCLLGHVPRWTRPLPLVLLFIGLVAVGLAAYGAQPALPTVEAIARYTLGLPSVAAAALSLVAIQHARRKANLDRIGQRVSVAAGILAAYAFFAGVIVPRAPFPPAAWLNTETFLAATGLHIAIPRALCAAAACALLSEAFIVDTARAHAEWEQRREEFIAVVANDLRSPIGAIKLGSQALDRMCATDRIDADVARTRALLRNIASSASSLDRMVADLLDASRIEAHHLPLSPAEVDLVPFLDAIAHRSSAITRGRVVTTSFPSSLPPVHADAVRIEQVLTNLLSNAAMYSAPETEIRIDAVERAGSVEVSVTCVGHALSRSEGERLFDRFQRRPAERGKEGLGLGLYIAKGLVEAHGGRIWLDNAEANAHTSFRFTLPLESNRLLDLRGHAGMREEPTR
jgi:signal transduction histidine kinase